MIDTTWIDATGQAELVRRGEVRPDELVEAAIARIVQVNPALDAVIRTRFDQARAEAAGDLPNGPFRGVPIVLKDLGCLVAGEATAFGVGPLRDVVWPVTSYLAAHFRQAGFIALGRTNVPELGTTVTTEAKSFPPSRNPWQFEHSSGGSSGGAAAAVASGMVAAAHASDGGGSIRIPASACGLFGLKPTRGRISQGPAIAEGWGGSTTDGVLTRTVRDSAAILDVISGRMPGEPYYAPALPRALADEVGADPGRLRVGLLDHPGDEGNVDHPECRAAVIAAGRMLERLGHHVEESYPVDMFDLEIARCFTSMISADSESTFLAFERALGRPIHDDEIEPRNAAYRRTARKLDAVTYVNNRARVGRWARRIAQWWTDHDLLVTPTLGSPPPRLGWFTEDGPVAERQRIRQYCLYTAPFNMTGQPAMSVPLHWTPDGLPVGVHIVAPYGREDLLIRVASQLEQAAPWSDRRPPVHA
jgi:amidase